MKNILLNKLKFQNNSELEDAFQFFGAVLTICFVLIGIFGGAR